MMLRLRFGTFNEWLNITTSRDKKSKMFRSMLPRQILRKYSAITGKGLIQISFPIRDALRKNIPIVALESTIITHGMPWPHNLQTALEVEEIIRAEGCVPATIAVMDSHVKIGLTRGEMETLARASRDQVAKVSRRDLAPVLAGKKLMGSTTVSATMLLAHQAGISVFVTGGIGGVHRGGQDTMDVSADLTELSRTPVAVVCAGIKSILDIGRSLEYLETMGVSVTSVGESAQFPAFYTPDSGFKSPSHVRTADEAADILHTNETLKLNSGMVFAVPIPSENAGNAQLIEESIQAALIECQEKNIVGRDVTPYILGRLAEMTKHHSLEANIALIKNNAKVGGQIATRLANLRAYPNVFMTSPSNHSGPVFVGCAAVDMTCKFDAQEVDKSSTNWSQYLRTSSPAKVKSTAGGVARNAAEACFRLTDSSKAPPKLVAPIGNDTHGEFLETSLSQIGMDITGLHTTNDSRTAVYNALLDSNGGLIAAGADMNILKEAHLDIDKFIDPQTPMVCMDGNLTVESALRVLDACERHFVPLFFEPTSVPKATRIFSEILPRLRSSKRNVLSYISPNEDELVAMSSCLGDDVMKSIMPHMYFKSYAASPDQMRYVSKCWPCLLSLQIHIQHMLSVVPGIILKMGSDGFFICRMVEQENVKTHEILHYPPTQDMDQKIVSVTGAGDSLVGAMIAGFQSYDFQSKNNRMTSIEKHNRLFNVSFNGTKERRHAVMEVARRAAEMSLQSQEAVHPELGRLQFQ